MLAMRLNRNMLLKWETETREKRSLLPPSMIIYYTFNKLNKQGACQLFRELFSALKHLIEFAVSCELEDTVAYVSLSLDNGDLLFFLVNSELRMRCRIYHLLFLFFFHFILLRLHFLALIKLNSHSLFGKCPVETGMQKLDYVGVIAV